MRTRLAISVAAALAGTGLMPAPAPAAAPGPVVDTFVVGRTRVLKDLTRVRAPALTVRASGKRCGVGSGTPLSALVMVDRRGGPAVRLRDHGACSRRTADGGGLFVTGVGPDRNRGRNGWVYKVGRRLGTAGAADPSGPFGTGRLRSGQRVVWFWCTLTRAGTCQRTLEARPASRSVRRGAALTVVVRSFDDFGRGRSAPGALVRAGSATARADARGRARLRMPRRAGRVRVRAGRSGMVPAIPVEVRIR